MRRASVLFFGIFATGAALQGAAACSSNSDSPAASNDSGTGENSDTGPGTDTGTPPTVTCHDTVPPVMTVVGPDGGEIEGDWSCYGPDASAFIRPAHPPVPFDSDASDDGGVDASDASDASSAVDAADAAPPTDASPEDSSAPDASPAPDGGDSGASDYILQLTDFVSTAPPVGATVNLVWGQSTLGPIAFTGTVNATGELFFPAPPAGVTVLTYNVVGSSDGDAGPGQAPLWWFGIPIATPPAAATFNSLSKDNLTSLVKSVLGSENPNAQLATLVTGATDCQYRDVIGGQFSLVDAVTGAEVPTGSQAGDMRAFYLRDNLPDTSCTYTTNGGGKRAVWAAINAPTNLTPGATAVTHDYELVFKGRTSASQPAPVVVAQHKVESYPGTVSVLRGSLLNTSPPN